MSNYKVFIDMDGVLADFVGSICRAHNRPNVYEHPETRGISLGLFDIEGIWGITAKEFWAPSNSEEFWKSIPVLPDAYDLVETVYDLFGESNVAVLTAPSMSAGCIPGKQAWINRYLPELNKKIIFTGAKEFIAGPNKLLIDDRDKNVDGFVNHGGQAVLVPRLWNRAWSNSYKSHQIVKEGLLKITNETSYN